MLALREDGLREFARRPYIDYDFRVADTLDQSSLRARQRVEVGDRHPLTQRAVSPAGPHDRRRIIWDDEHLDLLRHYKRCTILPAQHLVGLLIAHKPLRLRIEHKLP